MDWLRSEDLNEEKVITTSELTLSRWPRIYCSKLADRLYASISKSRCRLEPQNLPGEIARDDPGPRGVTTHDFGRHRDSQEHTVETGAWSNSSPSERLPGASIRMLGTAGSGTS